MVINIADPNPVLCLSLMMSHTKIKLIIKPKSPGNIQSKKAMTSVIRKEVKNT